MGIEAVKQGLNCSWTKFLLVPWLPLEDHSSVAFNLQVSQTYI